MTVQLASDAAAAFLIGVGIKNDLAGIGTYPGKTYSASWKGFWKVIKTYVGKGAFNKTVNLAVNTIGNAVNSFFGADILVNDAEQLWSDANSN